ncbi:MAG: formate dehydrogenase [Caldimonas sp.]
MKLNPFQRSADVGGGKVERRGLILGAGVAGVAAVTTQILRGHVVAAPGPVLAKALPSQEAGYQVTPHVLRYYETTKS